VRLKNRERIFRRKIRRGSFCLRFDMRFCVFFGGGGGVKKSQLILYSLVSLVSVGDGELFIVCVFFLHFGGSIYFEMSSAKAWRLWSFRLVRAELN
jgi:hypothetical protein